MEPMSSVVSHNRLAKLLRLVPWGLPGKARLARLLLHRYFDERDLVIGLSHGTLLVPSIEEPVAFHAFIDGVYEPDLVNLFAATLQLGDVVIDVGANVGLISLEAARHVGPSGCVIAIEASPAIQPYLARNIERNNIRNVKRFRCAAHDADHGSIDFYEAPATKFGMGAVAPQFNVTPTVVPCRTLDSIVIEERIKRVRLIKIDVEGAEASVLRGAMSLLRSDAPPIIVFEFSDWGEARMHGASVGDAQRLLRDAGFSIWTLGAYAREQPPLREILTTGYTTLVAERRSNVVRS
jgi:FkbM family methyltransferase